MGPQLKFMTFVSVLLILTLLLPCLLCGCRSSSSKRRRSSDERIEDSISGIYDYGEWSVYIYDDATYKVYDNEGAEAIKKGTWQYNKSDAKLIFNGFAEGEDTHFIKNKDNFILFDKDENQPYYYDELSVSSGNVLDFTYVKKSITLRFQATGDIKVSGDNYLSGEGTYTIEGDKIYAYYKYTTPSARDYANGAMYFYIYDDTHVIPYNCIMIRTEGDAAPPLEEGNLDGESVSEGSTVEEPTEEIIIPEDNKSVYDEALTLIKSGKNEEAYNLLIANKFDSDAAALLERFIVVPKKKVYRESDGEETKYVYQYNSKGELIKETEIDTDGDTDITEYSYYDNGNVKKKTCTYTIDGGELRYGDVENYDERGGLASVESPTVVNGEVEWEITRYTNTYIGDKISRSDEYVNGSLYYSTQYFYDTKQMLIRESYSDYFGMPSPAAVHFVDYEYDEKGNVVSEHSYANGESFAANYDNTVEYKYEYNSAGDIAKIEKYYNSTLKSTSIYEYNEYAILERIEIVDEDEVEYEEYSDYLYLYVVK